MYYDLEVPGVGHYLAEGFMHHNTGKTISALNKLNSIAMKYDRASIVIVRKTLNSCTGTVLQTFMWKVLGEIEEDWPCVRYGGERPQFFTYPNGARIWVAGLDKSSKILSAEHDIIYVNQTEEITLSDWETLTTRTTGRAGHVPYGQTIGDANPWTPQHWMYKRKSLKLYYSKHQENPVLYDPETGLITEQGRRTMAILNQLTGVRKTRLLKGLPDRAEGAIYDWDETVHLINRNQLPVLKSFVASQDWGFTQPGVLGIWGLDSDERMYLVAQIYRSGKTSGWWVKKALELSELFGGLDWVACDPAEPDYIQDYQDAGLRAVGAPNAVRAGLDKVMERLALAGDGRPRLFIVRDSLHYQDPRLLAEKLPHKIEDEFPGYVWADTGAKEQPVKEWDHGMDMVRYCVGKLDGLGKEKQRRPTTSAPRIIKRDAMARILG